MEGSLVAYKVFTNGSVLNASEVNENLMNQSVITFTNSTARASAITSPVEGMVTYLADTDTYQFWNGTAWTALVSVSSGNAVINGGFDIWQRGTSLSPTSGADNFLADRFYYAFNGTGSTRTLSQQTFTPGTAPASGYEAAFFLRHNCTVAGSGQTTSALVHKIEDVRTFAGQTVTFSIWAKADSTRNLGVKFGQLFGSGGSAGVNISGTTFALTTSWARYTFTVDVPSIAGKTIGAGSNFFIQLDYPLNTTQTMDIWGVQLEAGSTATPFRRNANSIQGELAACQRYYERITATAAFGSLSPLGMAISTTQGRVPVQFIVPKRVAPTSVEFGGSLAFSDGVSPAVLTLITLDSPNPTHTRLAITSSSLSQYRPYYINANNDTTAFIAVSAEL
jgi:hypothetical protein